MLLSNNFNIYIYIERNTRQTDYYKVLLRLGWLNDLRGNLRDLEVKRQNNIIDKIR